MCAIFQLGEDDVREIRDICDEVTRKYGQDAADACTGADIYPRQNAAVVGGVHKVALMQWGFSLENSPKVVFNARAENLGEKRMFRPVLQNRCLVPATAFYEFGQDHRKVRICMPAMPFFYLAALWRLEKTETEKHFCFTVLTTQPNKQIAAFHDRMPVVLSPASAPAWLDAAADMQPFLCPNEEPMRIDAVS